MKLRIWIAVVLVLSLITWGKIHQSDPDSAAAVLAATAAAAITPSTATARPTPTAAPKPPAIPSTRLRLHLIKTITGHITPKSVDSDQTGLIFAQNMVYTHTVTVYDSHSMRLAKTISDRVSPSKFGMAGAIGRPRKDERAEIRTLVTWSKTNESQ